MSLLTLSAAGFDYGREPILDGVDLSLNAGVRYALVGPNGAGKTTLLNVLIGNLTLQRGQRQQTGGVAIRYLRQESEIGDTADQSRPLREVVRNVAFAYELRLQAELDGITSSLAAALPAEQAPLIQRQGRVQSEFERLDGYGLDTRLEAALRGVGLPAVVWTQPVSSLSGGERRRAALAATLLGHADLLLLDEPTNHLDLASCEWLESYLRGGAAAAVIISHDRWFLDRVAVRTLHLERGKLADYAGNYTVYQKARRERLRQEQAAWQRQQDHIRQTEAFIRKNIEGQKTKQAQARRKQLDKLDRRERPTSERADFRFDLRPQRASGGTVLQADGLSKGYGGRTLFHNLDLLVVRGERVGIIGPNGCGKTTLLKVLAGQELADGGRVVRGHNVDLGVYDQNLTTVNDLNTVLGEIQSVDPAALIGDLRSFLAAFGFGADLIDRPVGRLSGGERGRLALLRLIKEGHNTLLLDEATNHLDIRSRESLERALGEFTGTLVMVSHDRRFIDRLVDRLVVFPDAGAADRTVRVFLGNYADLVREREAAERGDTAISPARQVASRPDAAGPDAATATTTGLSKNEQVRRKAWIDEVEASIAAMEVEKANVIEAMSVPDASNEKRRRLADRCTAIDTELEDAMSRWETWQAELDGSDD